MDFTPSDDELLRRIKAGDEEAFVSLYRGRQAGVYRFALQMSGSEAVAEDVVQEVFMALMSEAKGFDSARGSLSSYLYGMARNQVLRRLAKDRFYVPMGDDAAEADGAFSYSERLAAPGDPLGDLTHSQMVERLREAVLKLPAHYREVVVLCDLNEMGYAEAAEALGCAVGTVRSRLHRARALLIEKLRANDNRNTAPNSLNTVRCFA